MKKHNFYAGPSILPRTVFEEASQALLNFNNSGLSIMEISHRSRLFMDVIEEAQALIKELIGLGDDFEVLFLSGGATSQFYMTAMNFLDDNETAAYIDTGVWSDKAIKEARKFGNVVEVASSKDQNYAYIPKSWELPKHAKFLHITTNNTVTGTQFHKIPNVGVPIVADMSSDILSKPINVLQYGTIYAGAQKNTGGAGTTLVLVRRDMLNTVKRDIPTMLDYRAHIKKASVLNTPPVFPIYVSLLNLRWLKGIGGVTEIQKRNEEKAALLYNEIDRNSCFIGKVAKEDRSLMNATFLLNDENMMSKFLELCDAAGIVGIKGHRIVGGFRASMYNALAKESVEALVEVMQAFEEKYG
jgi:phosphoserine aminotransferase